MASVSIQWFNKYVEPNPKPIRHIYYDATVKKYKRIKVHSDGEMPKELIEERRPAESLKIQEYRKKIYVSTTQPLFTKVYNSLMKIRKSQDWSVKFDPQAVPSRIVEGERLEDYLMRNFPKYTSIPNWYFQIGLKQQLIDTNAKVFVMPIEKVSDNTYMRPFPFIYNSQYVIDYKYKEYYVLQSPQKITFVENNQTFEGDRYYVVTDTNIQTFDQVTVDKKFRETDNFLHNLEYIPVFDMKGIVMDETFYQTLYDSKICSMMPFLDEAAREYSDQQAEVVQHVHSTLWAYQPNDCKKCKGTGELISKKEGAPVKGPCDRCKGNGFYPFNPYENLVLGKQEPGSNPVPTPPAGFITKQTDIVKIQMERIDMHFKKALSAINMEFLAATPLNQSGVAKEVDKEELNNFVHGIAEDGVEMLDNVVMCINDYRYKGIVTDNEKRYMMLPTINVPEKFDLLGDTFLLEGIDAMKKARIDSAIVNAAEVEYAAKRFNTDIDVKEMVSLKLSLDPFAGLDDNAVNSRLAFNLITLEDAVIHANIHSFIERAMEENDGFKDLEKAEQMAILKKYAQEISTEAERIRDEQMNNGDTGSAN